LGGDTNRTIITFDDRLFPAENLCKSLDFYTQK